MDKKTLLMTLGAAAVVTVAGVSLYQGQQGSVEIASQLILPELSSAAGTLDHIKIEGANHTLLVENHKQGDKWLVDNLGNYEADTTPLSQLIKSLKDAKKLEAKTAKPELFEHLGLRDISDEQSKAVLVSVSAGDKSYQLLVGDGGKNGSGQYVRIAGDNQSWLIDKTITKPEKAEDWINTKLFDFTLEDIQSVSLSGKYTYVLNKENKEQPNFKLDSLPQDRKLKYDSIVDSIPRSIVNLKFEQLIKMADYKAADDAQQLTIKLFEKPSEIGLNLSKTDDKYYARLSGENPLWQNWAYQISEYNYNQLVKDKVSFMEEEKPASGETNGTDVPAESAP